MSRQRVDHLRDQKSGIEPQEIVVNLHQAIRLPERAVGLLPPLDDVGQATSGGSAVRRLESRSVLARRRRAEAGVFEDLEPEATDSRINANALVFRGRASEVRVRARVLSERDVLRVRLRHIEGHLRGQNVLAKHESVGRERFARHCHNQIARLIICNKEILFRDQALNRVEDALAGIHDVTGDRVTHTRLIFQLDAVRRSELCDDALRGKLLPLRRGLARRLDLRRASVSAFPLDARPRI